MELYWPSRVCPAGSTVEVLDNTGRFTSPLTGATRTISRPGSRLRMTLQFRNQTEKSRAALIAFLARFRGSDRVWSPDHAYAQRGSFNAPEILSAKHFGNGVDTWISDSEYTLSVTESVLRATRNAVTGSADLLKSPNSLTVVPNVPYVARAVVLQGRGAFASGFTPYATTGEQTLDAKVFGYMANLHVPNVNTVQFRIRDNQSTGIFAGDFVSIPFVSYARCALVDNAPNLLPYSDDFSNAAWSKTNLTVGATSVVLPTGASGTTQVLHEDTTAASSHFIEDSVTIDTGTDDYSFAIAIRKSNRTFARIMMQESSNNDTVSAYINLTTGAVTNTATAGSNWSDLRAFAQSYGNDWWYFDISARKLSAATTLTVRVYIGEAAGDITFTGGNQNSLFLWRATLVKSSVPPRLSPTTGTANSTGTEQPLAGGLNTKGWPVSTNGLLLPGDQVQIGDQLLIVVAPVNSDASGLAFLEAYPALHDAPANDTPIIVNQPMGKFMPQDTELGWNNQPSFLTGAELVLAEAS